MNTINSLELVQNEFASIQNLCNSSLHLNIPFALYRQPGTMTKDLLIDLTNNRVAGKIVLEESQTGFVISPFLNEGNNHTHFVHASLTYRMSDGPLQLISENEFHIDQTLRKLFLSQLTKTAGPVFPTSAISKPGTDENYLTICKAAISEIEKETFKKVVLARSKKIDLTVPPDIITIFLKLCQTYPLAFVSLLYHPMVGCWIGASPELLVGIDGQHIFKTVALAGTQRMAEGSDISKTVWTQKEIEEQALVNRYIINCFKKIRLREYDDQGPRTLQAGNLAHLRTDFFVDMEAVGFPSLGTTMLDLLHPTSAVCGMPKQEALDFITKNEALDRSIYSGFLGPVNVDGSSSLYVNLRCAQIFNDQYVLYAGAGITKDSDPDKEFEETEIKMDTLFKIFSAPD